MTCEELKRILRSRGLKVSGKKDELRSRVVESENKKHESKLNLSKSRSKVVDPKSWISQNKKSTDGNNATFNQADEMSSILTTADSPWHYSPCSSFSSSKAVFSQTSPPSSSASSSSASNSSLMSSSAANVINGKEGALSYPDIARTMSNVGKQELARDNSRMAASYHPRKLQKFNSALKDFRQHSQCSMGTESPEADLQDSSLRMHINHTDINDEFYVESTNSDEYGWS